MPIDKVKPLVQSRRDNTEYINLQEIGSEQRMHIINAAEQRAPGLLEQWQDPFVELISKTFNATILLPMRKKHMIVIYGDIDKKNNELIKQFKDYFEAETVITDWNGEDEIDDTRRTLLITETKPPYIQPYNALSLDGAMRLLET